ncbi:MAG: hypothetical protein B7Z50_05475, partial [Sphingomonadales bacterium 12-62-5]
MIFSPYAPRRYPDTAAPSPPICRVQIAKVIEIGQRPEIDGARPCAGYPVLHPALANANPIIHAVLALANVTRIERAET